MTTSLREAFWRQPVVPDCPIYDLHGHMGPLPGAHLPCCTEEAMLAQMDRAGVRWLVFCHHSSLFAPDIGNRPNIEAVRRHPGRFRAYCGINPNYPELVQQDIDSFDQFSDVYVGFKFLADYHQVSIDDARYRAAWELAHEKRLLMLLHTWGGSTFSGPEQVKRMAHAYPQAQILAGHSWHGQWQAAIDVARECPNVFLELTAVLDDCDIVATLVDALGPERIVFGTDCPWFNHHYYVGALLGAAIDDGARRSILHGNARRLLTSLLPEDDRD